MAEGWFLSVEALARQEEAAYDRGRAAMLAEVLAALRNRAETIASYDDAYRHAADYLDVRFGVKENTDD